MFRLFNFGLDFLRSNRIGINWSDVAERILTHNKEMLVESIVISKTDPKILTTCYLDLLARHLAVLNVKVDFKEIRYRAPS